MFREVWWVQMQTNGTSWDQHGQIGAKSLSVLHDQDLQLVFISNFKSACCISLSNITGQIQQNSTQLCQMRDVWWIRE